jgi:hypothetical protein
VAVVAAVVVALFKLGVRMGEQLPVSSLKRNEGHANGSNTLYMYEVV